MSRHFKIVISLFTDYGNPDPDPEDVHRGPRFRVQPQDTVHEPVVTEAVAADIVTLECIADAVPEPCE